MLTPIRLIAAALFTVCFLSDCNVSADEPVQSAGSTPDMELLKRFTAECVVINPGQNPFPGQFEIGSRDESENSLPPGKVAMTSRFRICQYEMTQELYETVMGTNPSRWKGRRNSVESISFSDAEECCRKLTAALVEAKLIAANEVVRLPTEAEWEYCCRAGTSTRYSFGESATAIGDSGNQASVLNDYAWHTGNAAGNDPAVGSLKPNGWQLYDMHGYLWEFVSEPFKASDAKLKKDETATPSENSPSAEPRCIVRGGSWQDHYSLLTSASRRSTRVSWTSDAIGFRCVISEQPQEP